jgi:hypothetical protein
MSVLGEVLEALYVAPRCRTLHGSIAWQVDWELRQQRSKHHVTLMAIGAGATSQPGLPRYEVWVDHLVGRLRIDAAPAITVLDGDVQLMYHPQSGAIRTVQPRRHGWPDALWAARGLISNCTLVVEGVVEYLGRPCWQLHAVPDDQDNLLFGMLVDGDRMELTGDQQTGVILRHHARADDGATLAEHVWTSFEVDVDVADTIVTAAVPPEAPVRTAGQMTLEHLAERGYDVTGVDPDDEAAIRDAMRGGRRGHNPLEQYVADRPPPDDPVAARRDIEAAFAAFASRDGDDLPHIEAGAGLGPVLDRVAARYPDLHPSLDVADVKFLNDHEAAVAATVTSQDGQRLLGPGVQRAVHRDGSWKLARSSFASLLGFIGVHLPPPDAGPSVVR